MRKGDTIKISCQIDKTPVTKVVLKISKGKACGMCRFSDWGKGDVKYIVEHGLNKDSQEQMAEHLCPSCAISRGLPFERYHHQNINAPPHPLHNISLMPEDWQEPPPKKARLALVPAKRKTNICQIAAKHLELAKTRIGACTLRPHKTCSLYLSPNGVILLVYEGFPPSLLTAKEILSDEFPFLQDESLVSQWPCTTLAAIHDHASESDLSLYEIQKLKDICQKHSKRVAEIAIPISKLSLVEYDSRGLEVPLAHKTMDLPTGRHEKQSALHLEESARVDRWVQEWDDDLPYYLQRVNSSFERNRIGSYREQVPNDEAACVAFLEPLPKSLASCLSDFAKDIEVYFPGRYAWLQRESLHCTVRNLHLNQDIVKTNFITEEDSADFQEAKRALNQLRQAAAKLGLDPDTLGPIAQMKELLQTAKTSTVFHLEGILHKHKTKERSLSDASSTQMPPQHTTSLRDNLSLQDFGVARMPITTNATWNVEDVPAL